ncbi:hypothetical protein [Streptomyces mayteni]
MGAVLLAGCSGGGSDDPAPETTEEGANWSSATEICGGAFRDGAAEDLEAISGTAEFREGSARPPAELDAFVESLRASESFRETLCEIYASPDGDNLFAGVHFRWADGETETEADSAPQDDWLYYEAGDEAVVTDRATLIYFPCPGTAPHENGVIGANLAVQRPVARDADAEMNILNSVSRAVADGLGCLAESGLPEGAPERVAG